jgi:hypothetical protein
VCSVRPDGGAGLKFVRFVEVNCFRGLINVRNFTALYTQYVFFLFPPVPALYTPMSEVKVKGFVCC